VSFVVIVQSWSIYALKIGILQKTCRRRSRPRKMLSTDRVGQGTRARSEVETFGGTRDGLLPTMVIRGSGIIIFHDLLTSEVVLHPGVRSKADCDQDANPFASKD
jgi:hypothetical protein